MTEEQRHFHFKGIKISDIDAAGLDHLIDGILSARRCAYFCMTDVGNLMMAQDDPQLTTAINRATLSIADGMPLAWFGKLIGRKNIQRISGVELFRRLIVNTKYKHFLLGDTPEMQQKVISKAQKENSNLRIGGYSPPFKATFSKADNKIIVDKIHKMSADIIWVSFGGGKQEKWMLQNIAQLDYGIMIGVGAAFKFYTGHLSVPPQLIQQLGLQWTTRVMKNPRRWMTKGQFKYRILFSLNFPREFLKAKRLNRSCAGFGL